VVRGNTWGHIDRAYLRAEHGGDFNVYRLNPAWLGGWITRKRGRRGYRNPPVVRGDKKEKRGPAAAD